MPDCFISYSTQDKRLADFIYAELSRHGIAPFVASVSLQPGQHWSAEILNNLRTSSWVTLLASKAACSSAFVNQEVGGALLTSKRLVPIVWDMSPTELPEWASQVQAIDLRGSTFLELQNHVGAIAARIKQEKTQGLLILGAIVLGPICGWQWKVIRRIRAADIPTPEVQIPQTYVHEIWHVHNLVNKGISGEQTQQASLNAMARFDSLLSEKGYMFSDRIKAMTFTTH